MTKRELEWLATAVLLQLNGEEAIPASNDEVYDFVIDVAARQQLVAEMASATLQGAVHDLCSRRRSDMSR